MYEFHYTLTPEEWKTKIRLEVRTGESEEDVPKPGKKKKKGIVGRLCTAWVVLLIIEKLSTRALEVYGRPGFLVFLLMVVVVFLLLQENVRYYLVLAVTKRRLKNSKADQNVRVVMTDTLVTVETGTKVHHFSWSAFQRINRLENLVVLWRKKLTLYIPVQVIGTEEEVQELLRYARECMERERHGTIDVKWWKDEYEATAAYCYLFERTAEEAAAECAQILPKPFISRKYWQRSVILSWTAVLFFTVFFCSIIESRFLWAIVACCYLWAIGRIIWLSRFEVRKRYLLKKNDAKEIRHLVGEGMMAFHDKGFSSAMGIAADEYSWSCLKCIRECESCLAFVFHDASALLLPTKVFESPAEKQQLIEFCSRRIKQK